MLSGRREDINRPCALVLVRLTKLAHDREPNNVNRPMRPSSMRLLVSVEPTFKTPVVAVRSRSGAPQRQNSEKSIKQAVLQQTTRKSEQTKPIDEKGEGKLYVSRRGRCKSRESELKMRCEENASPRT
jgi:hypothetical protein